MNAAAPNSPNPAPPDLATLDVELTTARLRLRPLVASDVDDLWPYVSDPEFPSRMTWAAHTDRSETLAFIAQAATSRAAGTDLVWAIEHAGHAVGCIGLHGIKWTLRAWRCDRAELGYWLVPPLHGRGLMTEAALEVVRFAFGTLGLHKLNVAHLEDNDDSRRVIEKIGFRFIGRCEDDLYRHGRWFAHLRYELLAQAWSDGAADIALTQPIMRPKR